MHWLVLLGHGLRFEILPCKHERHTHLMALRQLLEFLSEQVIAAGDSEATGVKQKHTMKELVLQL